MKVLVTGAAGFIGSVVTEALLASGCVVVALDNLSHGWRPAISPRARFCNVDIRHRAAVKAVLDAEQPDAVVHLAAESLVEMSVRDPRRTYETNVSGSLTLLGAMVDAGVTRIIFSSTAAVYGEPQTMPITETCGCAPVNAYGETKLVFERALAWYRGAYGLRYVTLRYFNACGASGRYGEFHVPETHLIPVALGVALGQVPSLRLYGTDYDTPDGTCIRDYVHVSDIAAAHVLALRAVDRLGARVYNLGSGVGYSNRQVIDAVTRVVRHEIPVAIGERRAGDPSRLVASADVIRDELGWRPEFDTIESMVASAWEWRKRQPRGYAL